MRPTITTYAELHEAEERRRRELRELAEASIQQMRELAGRSERRKTGVEPQSEPPNDDA